MLCYRLHFISPRSPPERRAGNLRPCHPCFKSQTQETPCTSHAWWLALPVGLFIVVYLTVLGRTAVTPSRLLPLRFLCCSPGAPFQMSAQCVCPWEFHPGWTQCKAAPWRCAVQTPFPIQCGLDQLQALLLLGLPVWHSGQVFIILFS